MNVIRVVETMNRRHFALSNLLVASLLLGLIGIVVTAPVAAQNGNSTGAQPPRTEVPFEIVSMKVETFDPAITLGAGDRAVRYRQALAIVAEVDRKVLGELPPSLAPTLTIGRTAVAIHKQEATRREAGRILLTFHVVDWQQLERESPIFLTTDVESVLRGQRKPSRDTPRFQPEDIE